MVNFLPQGWTKKAPTQEVMPPRTTSSFMGGVSDFTSGAVDTLGTLLQGGLMFEQFRAQRDAIGAGQTDVVTSVQRPTNPNATPMNPVQYGTVANGSKKNSALGGAVSAGVDSKMLLILGAVAIGAVLVLKK